MEPKSCFAKILLLELRNYPGYFNSETYQQSVRHYAGIILEIIDDGIKRGEICEDIPPKQLKGF